jgi:hypothetical protein
LISADGCSFKLASTGDSQKRAVLLDVELSVVSGTKVSSLACVDEKRAHPFCPESETDSVLANIHQEFSVETVSAVEV